MTPLTNFATIHGSGGDRHRSFHHGNFSNQQMGVSKNRGKMDDLGSKNPLFLVQHPNMKNLSNGFPEAPRTVWKLPSKATLKTSMQCVDLRSEKRQKFWVKGNFLWKIGEEKLGRKWIEHFSRYETRTSTVCDEKKFILEQILWSPPDLVSPRTLLLGIPSTKQSCLS